MFVFEFEFKFELELLAWSSESLFELDLAYYIFDLLVAFMTIGPIFKADELVIIGFVVLEALCDEIEEILLA